MSRIKKMDNASENIRELREEIEAQCDALNGMYGMDVFDACTIRELLYDALEKVVDDYNELEARHQKDTGMISEYDEENRDLKSELDIKTDECDALISRVFKQDDEYIKLEAEAKKLRENNELCMKAHLRLLDESTKLATENEELRSKCETQEDTLEKVMQEVAELGKEKIELDIENDYLTDRCDELKYRAAKYAWAIKTILKKASYSPGHVGEELRFMARKSITPKDVFERWEGIADELLGEHSKLVNKIEWLKKKNEKLSSQVSGLKEENDKLRVLTICGEIKWVSGEDDV